MRLKEIEQRLAAIRTELTTRGADMTDEEVATLEQEVTDLQKKTVREYCSRQPGRR